MKFLFHFYDLHQRAGIQRAISELSNALVENGHEVVLASCTSRAEAAFSLDKRIVLEEVPYPESKEARFATWAKKIVWGIRQEHILRRIVKRHRPSVVVDHGTALGLMYPGKSMAGIPFVLQRHFPVKTFPFGKFLYKALSLLGTR